VELEPVGPLLTLAQAAARLGVPEAFVTKLIEDGELTCRIERNRQTVVFEDLMAYRKKDDEETSKALDEMVAIAQELGLGY
jgi:excisionase family DNA binding protein